MDQRKVANQQVKDRMLYALIAFAGKKDWSKVTVRELIEQAHVARASFYRNFSSIEDIITYGIHTLSKQYHQEQPMMKEDFQSEELMCYKFMFYEKHADLVLAFHKATTSITLLDVITDCVIDANGDMPMSSIQRYELYYYAGAFYNMLLCWLESGRKESAQEMAAEFIRIVQSPSYQPEKGSIDQPTMK